MAISDTGYTIGYEAMRGVRGPIPSVFILSQRHVYYAYNIRWKFQTVCTLRATRNGGSNELWCIPLARGGGARAQSECISIAVSA